MQSWLEGKNWVGKGAKATGMTTRLRILSSKADSNTWESSRGVNWSWSHHAQTSSGKGLPSCQKHCQKHLTWAKVKNNWIVAQWSKVLFLDESKFSISFGNQDPRVWRKSAEAQNSCYLKSSVMFYWCWSTVFSEVHSQHSHLQDILEHFMLASAYKLYGDADFIFQQDLAPAHTAKGTKRVQWPWCYCAWLASKLAWPEPHREYMGFCQEEVERHQTQQCKWPEGRYQSNLDFHYIWAVPQADCLHATPHWCSNSCKRKPNQVLVHINEHTFQKPDISV